MPTIEISTAGKRHAVKVTKDGAVLQQFRFDALSPGSQATTARKCGIPVSRLLDAVNNCKDAPVIIETDKVESVSTEFTVRGMEQTDEAGEKLSLPATEFLNTKLRDVPVDKVLTWPDKAELCCLDVDYHEGHKPERILLEHTVLSRVAPKPFCWHFSRGGGLHMFYVRSGTLTAEELAAVAAIRFRMIDPTAGVELKRVVRGPGQEMVTFTGEVDSTGLMLDWLKEPARETGDRDEYLEEHGMELGRRYNHDKCPAFPSSDDGKHREPVVIGERGVTCYVCEGQGRTWGSRRPGWFPWTALLGHPSAGVVGAMVRGLCHWGHAKWILKEKYGLSGPLAELAYSAALKVYHEGKSTESLVPLAFNRDTDRLTRVGTEWMDLQDVKPYSNKIAPTIALLPFCQTVDEEGKPKVIQARVTNLMESVDWSERGYPPVQLIFGIKMAPALAPYSDAIVAVANPDLKKQGGDRVLPKYVPFSKRMPVEQAWGIVETITPGLNRNLVNLILCGVGSTQETMLGSPPRIFVSGPSMAAKSSHFLIAAGIAGVSVSEPRITGDDTRLRQAIKQGIAMSPILVINEIFKDSVRTQRKTTPVQALEPILTLEKNSMTHVMYRGAEKIGKQFVLGMTEITLPPDIRAETQLARRIRYVPLNRAHPEWRGLASAAKLKDFTELRLLGPEMVNACNSILSDAIDRFFSTPMSFDAQAESLGVQTLQDSIEFEDPTVMLRHFFKLVCTAPDITNPRLAKLYPRFKQISRNDESGSDTAEELFTIYSSLADATIGEEWTTSRKLEEKDWGMVLGVPEPVKLLLRSNGGSVFVRFQVGPLHKPEKVNAEIVDPTNWSTL